MCMLLNSHVCAKLGQENQRVWGQTSVMWSWTSFTPDGGREGEGERQSTGGAKEGDKVWPNSPSHRQGWLTPPSLNTNQSQTCQLDSTCTFPARVPLPDKTHHTSTLPLRQLTRHSMVLPVNVMTKVVYLLGCFIRQSWWEIWHTSKAIHSGTHTQVNIL